MKSNYVITDTDKFTDSMRRVVFNGFGKFGKETTDDPDEFIKLMGDISEAETQEMDTVLSFSEALTIVKELAKKQKNKQTQAIRYVINEKIFSEIVESMHSRLVSNILSGLIKKGLVDTAYDSEINDFVFWIKNADQGNTEQD